jgi:hypothetical protein
MLNFEPGTLTSRHLILGKADISSSILYLLGPHFHSITTCQIHNLKKPTNALYNIIKYCSIAPTYVSAPVEPSSGGQGYIHITSIS